jgi:dephospho-CoA kinase
MLRVGLTGSIAVGKSFVSGVLVGLGCHVVDADVLARKVVEPGTEGLRNIVEAFGVGALREDGTLNRAALSSVIFADEEKRALMNSIMHPLIMAEQDALLRQWEQEDPLGVGIIDAALLIESGGFRRFDKIIVVHCRPEVQLERLMRRNGLSREDALARISSQLPQSEKLKHADFAVDTSGGFDETRSLVEDVYEQLHRLAAD